MGPCQSHLRGFLPLSLGDQTLIITTPTGGQGPPHLSTHKPSDVSLQRQLFIPGLGGLVTSRNSKIKAHRENADSGLFTSSCCKHLRSTLLGHIGTTYSRREETLTSPDYDGNCALDQTQDSQVCRQAVWVLDMKAQYPNLAVEDHSPHCHCLY
jgi:hypothetical protein